MPLALCCRHSVRRHATGTETPMRHGDPARETSTGRDVLAGLVERVTFHSAESGFCVLRLKARGHRDLVTTVGHAATISAGEWVTASGEWVNDRTHGLAVSRAVPESLGPVIARGHREVSRLGNGAWHRPGLRTAHGQAFRQGCLRHHRDHAGAAAGGRRDRPQASREDNLCLG